jgi:hypothetical protein
LGIHLTWPNGPYFNSNYERWASLVIYKATEATALSSKSICIRLHLGHLNAVENVEVLAFCPLSSVKTRVLCFSDCWIQKRSTHVTWNSTDKNAKSLTFFNGISVTKVEPDGLGIQRRCLSGFVDY